MSQKPVISKKVCNEFQEHMVRAYVLREIEQEFDAVDIDCDKCYEPRAQGQRRTLIQQYYHTLDLTRWDDARKLLNVFANVLSQIEESLSETTDEHTEELNQKTFTQLLKLLKKDGFFYKDGTILSAIHSPAINTLKEYAVQFDANYLKQQIETMESSIETNPSLAIGTAKELVETTCKTILQDRSVEISETETIPKLVKLVCQELKLTPADISNANKAADTIKRILGNLSTVAQGIAELRNPYGTGHGRHAKTKGLSPRHARSAVGSAVTLATFLFETHAERDV